MTKEQAQTLAELFPHKTAEGNLQDGFYFSDEDPEWTLQTFTPSGLVSFFFDFQLEGHTYPYRGALIEKTLELIAEREGWDIERNSEIHSDEAGDFRVHFVEILDPYQGPLGNLDRKVLGKAEGEGGLNQFAAAMIAAKQGQS